MLRGSQGCPGHRCSPAIPLVNHVKVLQSGGDVVWAHARSSADRLDADVSLVVVVEILQDDALPIGQVGETAQVREWLFRRPCLAFSSRKQIAWGKKNQGQPPCAVFRRAGGVPLIILLGSNKAKTRQQRRAHISQVQWSDRHEVYASDSFTVALKSIPVASGLIPTIHRGILNKTKVEDTTDKSQRPSLPTSFTFFPEVNVRHLLRNPVERPPQTLMGKLFSAGRT